MNHYCVVLGLTGKGKSSFLNALFKNYGENQELEANGKGDGCTTKITPCKPIYINDDKYFFIDTPGLDDEDLDEKTVEALRYQSTDTKNRIKAILICLHIDDNRLSTSTRNMLKEFMNCFPLNDFWEHVLIIRTHVRENNLKIHGDLEESINKKMGDFMKKKNIACPKELNKREFFFNSVLKEDKNKKPILFNTGTDIKNEFKKVLEKIKRIHPFFRRIEFKKEYTKEEGNYKVTYEEYEYEDFNGKIETKPIEKNRDFIVKQVGKTGPYRDKRYVGTRTDCWGDEYRVYQDYKYYIDEKGNKCDFFDVGGEYEL